MTDPQIDFLSPKGVTWGVVGESVQELNTVENIGRLFVAAKKAGIAVAISPHYYYPTDKGWKFEGALEKAHAQDRDVQSGEPLFDGWASRARGRTSCRSTKSTSSTARRSLTSPHKVYGPEANDLVLQLRKNGVDQVILAGMSANLCVEAHLRELLEQGFEVAVVKDATAAARIPEGDGYLAAIINFRYMANAVWTTDTAVKNMGA